MVTVSWKDPTCVQSQKGTLPMTPTPTEDDLSDGDGRPGRPGRGRMEDSSAVSHKRSKFTKFGHDVSRCIKYMMSMLLQPLAHHEFPNLHLSKPSPKGLGSSHIWATQNTWCIRSLLPRALGSEGVNPHPKIRIPSKSYSPKTGKFPRLWLVTPLQPSSSPPARSQCPFPLKSPS